ncbi:ferrichrome ABC transporter permease protein FhuB [Gottschalkia acidurici 9a]|uniref:Ferrichrome ABC transporter permease protein FhuB n=1 Tax=Gottschalkia acidurici (strain ATCC 7906 / DSM 604 / BCRC 14475 / CIP 104303 / KCTC 5404 / NCIMB 10678 / 9a) TaxID=1128398 RepID=K0AUF0_GOTA9|nr:iron ABC transporter permease [Gottschalkia acidurici]AFS77473.1 ferrichrome ABC transporter permease protein FhuB [Gottschalkia acidurici 9a]
MMVETKTDEIEVNDKLNIRSRPLLASFIIVGGIVALVLGIALSVSFGAANIKVSTVWEAIFNFNPNLTEHIIIQDLRLPRVLGGAIVGACFAISGAIMQGMTRNPLADSGIMGLNSGAGFALAVCFAFFPGTPYLHLILYSFLGAGMGAAIVFGVGSLSKNGLTPVRLVLAGAAVSTLLSAFSQGIAIYFDIGQDLAFWTAGGVAGTTWIQLKIIAPWVAIAIAGAIILSPSITLLSLGDEVAKGLGLQTKLVKIIATIIVLMLAGVAVSVVGAVGFVGLIIPHLTRYLVGVDYRYIIPCSGVLGSLLVVLADLVGRGINPPYETPIGAIISLIGVPFFLYLARKERREL